ncbi:MAG TPA: PspC domain-containing protein [Sphingomicrobium sp.]|nr:PspC domain-containing protein [Sphingomicrobium sp.]
MTIAKEYRMTATATPLPLRNDTILGVCEAIGQDFGFNPNWLRLAFIAPIFFAPLASLGVYLGLGLLVAATRWFAPHRPASEQVVEASATVIEEEALPLAA